MKESCFPDCWKVSLVVPVFKNAGETIALLVFFLGTIEECSFGHGRNLEHFLACIFCSIG